MVYQLFFAFFEFFPLLNSGIMLDTPSTPRSLFTQAQYTQYIEEKVETLAATGAKLIIVSSVEEHEYTFYDSAKVRAGAFNNYSIVPPYIPNQPWNDNVVNFNGVEVLLSKADELGLKVVLGTGRNGDKALMGDIYQKYVNGVPKTNIYGRWTKNVSITRDRIKDLHDEFKHHESFYRFLFDPRNQSIYRDKKQVLHSSC